MPMDLVFVLNWVKSYTLLTQFIPSLSSHIVSFKNLQNIVEATKWARTDKAEKQIYNYVRSVYSSSLIDAHFKHIILWSPIL